MSRVRVKDESSFFKILVIPEVAKRKHTRTYRGKILTF